MVLAVLMHEDCFIGGAAGIQCVWGENEISHQKIPKKSLRQNFTQCSGRLVCSYLSFQRTLTPECEVKLKGYRGEYDCLHPKIGGDFHTSGKLKPYPVWSTSTFPRRSSEAL